MSDRTRRVSVLYAVMMVVCLSLVISAAPVMAAPARNLVAGVVPPVGDLYNDLGVKFWQWSWSIPYGQHPLADNGDISAGQSGPVWFIGGTYVPTFPTNTDMLGQEERWGTIPAGKFLFFPLMNAEASTLEGNGETEEDLTACVECLAGFMNPKDLFCEVDGVSVKDVRAYRALSGPDVWGPLPADSVLLHQGYTAAVEGATSLFMADGYYILLAPMSLGAHTIHFGGHAHFGCGMTLTLDITYHITVQ